MRKKNPWKLLRRRIEPFADELDRATPWRVEPPACVLDWLLALTWHELQMGDIAVESLCEEPPELGCSLVSLTSAVAKSDQEEFQGRLAQQVMHRLIFAIDLSFRLPKGYRDDFQLTGDYRHDAEEVLVYAWRSSSARYWAQFFGQHL
ncbi:MAG: hypothetical protein KGJ60_11975 [Verrucomicrobiota bacterium]|nr:hypothetical protein [Verrucomicrobiota bacterium]